MQHSAWVRHGLWMAMSLVVLACGEEPSPPPPSSLHSNSDSESRSIHTNVVYGRDDRLDFYQISNPAWREVAASTAALVRNNRISPRPGGMYQIKTSNFGRDYNLCPTEPFQNQDTVAFCSGFFIGGDLMVTAGHCIRTSSDCNETFFVFGFAIDHEGGSSPSSLPAANVYRCFSVVNSTMSTSDGVDFAVVRLDRPVAGVKPLTLRSSSQPPAVGDELAVIGHPAGLPTKFAANAFVRTVNPGFLVTSLDTYGGNSGSAVFNVRTGEVEGVLVRGEADFKYEGNCRVSNTCLQNGCRGEDVTRIDHVRAILSKASRPRYSSF